MTSITPSVACPPEMQEALGTVARIGGPELVRRMAGLFEPSLRERLTRVAQLRAAGDFPQVARVAHAIKGSAAQMGCEGLRREAEYLEANARSLGPGALDHAIAALTAAAETAQAQLTTYLSQLES